MMFIALVLGGLYSFPRLPVQDEPDIAFPFIFVNVGYAGTPPSQMETEVTRKVEDAVSNIIGVKHMSSNVSTGSSQTVIEFEFNADIQQSTLTLQGSSLTFSPGPYSVHVIQLIPRDRRPGDRSDPWCSDDED